MPKRVPQPCKAAREEGVAIGKPVKLRGASEETGLQSDVWFKQDDQFDQPYVYAKVKVQTNDLMFPKTTESHVFIGLWQNMLQEHTRELKYMADMAGISFD